MTSVTVTYTSNAGAVILVFAHTNISDVGFSFSDTLTGSYTVLASVRTASTSTYFGAAPAISPGGSNTVTFKFTDNSIFTGVVIVAEYSGSLLPNNNLGARGNINNQGTFGTSLAPAITFTTSFASATIVVAIGCDDNRTFTLTATQRAQITTVTTAPNESGDEGDESAAGPGGYPISGTISGNKNVDWTMIGIELDIPVLGPSTRTLLGVGR